MAATTPCVSIVDDATAERLLAGYRSELDETFFSYRGTTELTRPGDYARIDGPGVWIEFVWRDRAIFPEVRYHTVYRDRRRDHDGALP
jgi:hypothetical protein